MRLSVDGSWNTSRSSRTKVKAKRERGAAPAHPGASTIPPNKQTPAAPNHHVNLARPGIDTVFDEFFDYGSGSFDHFAGRNLAGHSFRKQSNATHGIEAGSSEQ